MKEVKGDSTTVVLARRHCAKDLRDFLDSQKVLSKDFRMVPSKENGDAIAIPVCGNFLSVIAESSHEGVLGTSEEFCPYSTSVLGNQKRKQTTAAAARPVSPLEQALASATQKFWNEMNATGKDEAYVLGELALLDSKICPKRLELLGDDRTVVLHPTAFSLDETAFNELLVKMGFHSDESKHKLMLMFWEELAVVCKSSRVVRKGEVRPESGVRESNFKILWTNQGVAQSGPGGPGWITVTEQGIQQSFDLTRVMFSRGNITEKVRFGKLVQKDEVVLDLYSGIGYFTLPALVIGKAKHVYACEWNIHAVEALRYNLAQNGVANCASVFHGDSRTAVALHGLENKVNRVSLGLLPSSEGGWESAVRALRRKTGGWLHVHGNVPVKEMNKWAFWLCSCLASFVKKFEGEERDVDWAVICSHVEKVKSFAPTVNHYVADVFVGPMDKSATTSPTTLGMIVHPGGSMDSIPPDATLTVPSCALSPDGPLHQSWMREIAQTN
mmetsp:Transcript_12408/g.34419  ORF Transcript_12408/g.34419 Transcript_12408/m.34419 type:complete len:499 (-) Transcript_12408:2257-3753(-)